MSCPAHIVSNCGRIARSSSPPELCSQSKSVPASIPSVIFIVVLFAINCPSESKSLHENPLNGSMSIAGLLVADGTIFSCPSNWLIASSGGSLTGSLRVAPLVEGFADDFLQSSRSEVAYLRPRLCGLLDVFCNCVMVPWIARRTPRSPSLLIAPANLACE